MRFEPIKHVCDLLALVGSKSGYVDQRLHSFGACESYDRTGIRVSRYYDWRASPSVGKRQARGSSIRYHVAGHHTASHMISDVTMEQPRPDIVRLHIDDLGGGRKNFDSVDA